MLTYIFILIILLPFAFLSSTIEDIIPPDELNAMGIRLENSHD